MELTGYGIRADLPSGWEGTIALDRDPDSIELVGIGASLQPVAHLASFALPSDRGDFGSGAVDVMSRDDVFVALVEFAPEEAGAALFAQEGLPRRLDPRAFSERSLQRGLPGQAGLQVFFHEAGRAFCLYVVLGDADDAHRLVRDVEQVLATLTIEARR